MILAIVGDITSDEAFAAAETRVRRAGRAARCRRAKPVEPPPPTRRIVVVDKPDAVQTEIRVGQLAIPRKHSDYLAWDLAVKILGGEGANRLHRVLRSERGLTYGASADTQAMKQAGDFVAETDTRTETTGEALRLMVDEFARLQRAARVRARAGDAQAYLAGSFPLTIETPNEIATQVLNAVFYELPVEEIATFRERVQAVTPDDIQRVARELHPAGPPVDRAGRQRQGVRAAAPRRRLHRVRGHSDRRAGPDVGDAQERTARSVGIGSFDDADHDLLRRGLRRPVRRRAGRELRARVPDVEIFGFGGPRLAGGGRPT